MALNPTNSTDIIVVKLTKEERSEVLRFLNIYEQRKYDFQIVDNPNDSEYNKYFGETKKEKNTNSEDLEEVKNLKTNDKAIKRNTGKIIAGVSIGVVTVGLAGVLASFAIKDVVKIKNFEESAITKSNIEVVELIDNDKTSLDEIIAANQAEYNNYNKLLSMVYVSNEINGMSVSAEAANLDLTYADLTYSMVHDEILKYYEYLHVDNVKCQESASKLNFYKQTIDEYKERYGEDILRDFASMVILAKTCDSNNLDSTKIHEFNLKDEKLSFVYDNDKYVTSEITDQDKILAKKTMEDIEKNTNFMLSANELKVIAANDFDVEIEKRR